MERFKHFFLSEQNIMTAIILNAVVIFLMYFPQFKGSITLEIIDILFLVFVIVEAGIKLSIFKPSGYFALGWNRFDFAIVVASLPTILTHLIPIPSTSLLIVLRLFRLVRLVRFLRFIPNLGEIVEGLGRALRASVFVLAALVVIDFLLAIFTCHFYADIAPEYFGDPLIAAYSIFQMFTVEGWNEIPNLIAERSNNPFIVGVSRFYFVLVVLSGGIFGMSLANAVFVDEMTFDNNRVLEGKIDELQNEISELKALIINSGASATENSK